MNKPLNTLNQMPEVCSPDYKLVYAELARRLSAINAYLNVGEITPDKKLSYIQDDVEQAMMTISSVERPFLLLNPPITPY